MIRLHSGVISQWADRYYVRTRTTFRDGADGLRVAYYEVRDSARGSSANDNMVVHEYKTIEEAEAMCKILNS